MMPAGALTVDVGARTITGLIVPYGRTGRTGGRHYRFAPGRLTYGRPAAVTLLRDHAWGSRVGRAVTLTETPAGLLGCFAVVRGVRGDRALALADQEKFGLSAGLADDAEWEPDPADPRVRILAHAGLVEASLTDSPAFDWR